MTQAKPVNAFSWLVSVILEGPLTKVSLTQGIPGLTKNIEIMLFPFLDQKENMRRQGDY